MISRADVAVVGGGLTGAAAAVAAAAAGLSTLHFTPSAPPDRRTSALMLPSLDFLKQAGLTGEPSSIGAPLRQIRLIDATRRLVRAGETLFDAAEFGFDAFGYNIPNAVLLAQFAARAAKLPSLTVIEAPASQFIRESGGFALSAGGERFEATLLVGADGRGSAVRDFAAIAARIRKYRQAALVADLTLERPLGDCSVEFHYENGPFTLVPAGGEKANLVWIDRREVLEAASHRASLEAAILARSSRLFGAVGIAAGPHIFELVSLAAREVAAPAILLIGEAAHAFPPIGAQGLNIGLRDVAAFGSLSAETTRDLPDWPQTLSAAYAEARRTDVARTSLMVDMLFRSLIAGFLPADVARSAGLMAMRSIPALRRAAFEMGMGRR
ncbi:MAG: FAD-dependent monooxygenase [Cucumibacter sp.]